MKISISSGYAIVPDNAKLIDVSKGKHEDIGIIRDIKGELPTLTIIFGKSVGNLTMKEEERIVNEIIKDLPEYYNAKRQELPYPAHNADEDEWLEWSNSFRLRFFPIAMLIHFANTDYQLIQNRTEK